MNREMFGTTAAVEYRLREKTEVTPELFTFMFPLTDPPTHCLTTELGK